MRIVGTIDIPIMFHILHVERINRYIDKLDEEASAAALNGKSLPSRVS